MTQIRVELGAPSNTSRKLTVKFTCCGTWWEMPSVHDFGVAFDLVHECKP